MRSQAMARRPEAISRQSLEALLCNHGTEYETVLAIARQAGESQRVGNSDTLVAEITHAASEEMAIKLEDVVLRRTDLGSGGHPGRAALEQAALRLQQLAGWSDQRRQSEVDATERVLHDHHAAATAMTCAGAPALSQS